ncbi:UrcA family protein [Polymorphobacter megasporae]|uniref:UrcA family protein n=1 Tax=Glacieibacterium megasporae TaxID=2835787 RepID=UPI001C1DD351|nr:UrcA family protein [Polymorphobacter megasporae]UAJ08931.1 UrcA family protein [Polymorphobacter megasporae]
MKTILALFLAVVPASGAIAGLPSAAVEAPQAIVHYGDLNLSDPLGAATLRSRIDATIIRLSGGTRDQIDTPVNGAKIAMAKARKHGRAQADCLIAAANAEPRSPEAAAS